MLIPIRNLPVTEKYAKTVETNEASVWVASGMDLTEFRKMKDAGKSSTPKEADDSLYSFGLEEVCSNPW